MPFSDRLKILFNRDAQLRYTVKEFAHYNRNLLIIVADPKTDRIFATHKDKFVNGVIKSPTGKKQHVVREVLKYSRFNQSIDQFLTAIMETLHLPLWRASNFYQFIDGAVFNIAKGLRKAPPKAEKPTDKGVGLVPSPLSVDNVMRSGESSL